MLSRLRFWPALCVIAAAPTALLWPLVLQGRVLYWGTPLLQFYEWRSLAVEAYRAGHFPLWTHALGNGYPLLANLQSAALYPLNSIYLFMPVEHAMGYSVIVHLVLAGCFTFLFVRGLGLGPTAAVVSALAYSLSGFLVGRVQFISMTNSAAWLPLLFWLTGRVMARRRVRDALLLGLTIALQFLAGHAQLWYYSLWGVALYAGFLAVTSQLGRLRALAAGGSLMVVSLAVGLLAAAAQLLPTIELAALSQRSGGAAHDFAMTYSFWPWRLITLIAPDSFGSPAHGDFWGYANYWEDAGYLGVFPFLLALVAVIVWLRGSRRPGQSLRQTPFFVALALLALLLAFGKNLPVYPLVFRHVPGFSFFQAPARFLYWYAFAVAVLAGIGLDRLGTSERWVRASRYLLALALSLIASTAAIAGAFNNLPRATFLPALIRLSILSVLSAIVVFIFTHRYLARRLEVWHGLTVALVLADLLWFGLPLNPTTDPAIYHLETDTGRFLRQQAALSPPFRVFSPEGYNYDVKFDQLSGYFRFADFGPSDPEHLRGLRESLIPNLPVIEGIRSTNNYDPLQVGHYQALMDRLDGDLDAAQLKVIGLMNGRYIVTDRPPAGLSPVRSGPSGIYENPAALPRAWVATSVWPTLYAAWPVADEPGEIEKLFYPAFDPRTTVMLHASDQAPRREEAVSGDAEVTLQDGPNSVRISATLPTPGYLVLADTDYPSWRVTVDGEARHAVRANFAFRALWLPAGQHQVDWRYEPTSFRVGLWISAATWSIVAIVLAFGWLRYRRSAIHS